MADHRQVRHSSERHAGQLDPGVPSSRVVAEFQRALLPAVLPVLARVRIAAHYLAGPVTEQAGGDWFDAVAMPSGNVALVVGDVVGHGVPAVAAMGKFRSVLGEQLASEPDLRVVLARVDAFVTRTPELRSSTLAVAELDPAGGALRYITCGHPPLLVVGPDGTTGLLPATGTGPLGTGSEFIFGTAALRPGELLLLYSDGLIQRRHVTASQSIAELRGCTQAAVSGVAVGGSAADRVCQQAIASLTGPGYDDDVVALAAELMADPVPDLDLEFPAEVASVLRARRAFTAWLDRIDPALIDGNDLLLAVVETVTNAVEHAYPEDERGVVRFRAALGDDGNLECRVSDHGRWLPPSPDIANRGHGLMVAGQVVDAMRISRAMPPPETGPGGRGTVVTLRRRLRRAASITTDISDEPAEPDSATAFSVEIDGQGTEPCAKVSGPVDGSTAERLSRQILSACRGGTLPITLDLTGITYLASSGVRAIYQVREHLAAHQQDLTIVAAASGSAHTVLDVARLPHVSR